MKLDWPYSNGLACAGDVVDGSKCYIDGGAHDLRLHSCNIFLSGGLILSRIKSLVCLQEKEIQLFFRLDGTVKWILGLSEVTLCWVPQLSIWVSSN